MHNMSESTRRRLFLFFASRNTIGHSVIEDTWISIFIFVFPRTSLSSTHVPSWPVDRKIQSHPIFCDLQRLHLAKYRNQIRGQSPERLDYLDCIHYGQLHRHLYRTKITKRKRKQPTTNETMITLAIEFPEDYHYYPMKKRIQRTLVWIRPLPINSFIPR